MKTHQLKSLTWWEAEPDLLVRELKAVNEFFPDLKWVGDGPGYCHGPVPSWPFLRPAPQNLDRVLGDVPFEIRVQYGHAFPAAPPSVFPLEPRPPVELRSFTDYHVLSDGSLCLLQDAEQWTSSSLTSDLVLKAAAWRVEYALFQVGAIEKMTQNGIVVDDVLDSLLVERIEELLLEG
ncbi:hypothetical protein PV772_09520 [Pseudarthrobacter sp. CC12]|uniref:hypothetical protein n=1 Tax=Pseudarthrobacter sp. CC12 TaxID=3029193 RepID=UPI0032649E27